MLSQEGDVFDACSMGDGRKRRGAPDIVGALRPWRPFCSMEDLRMETRRVCHPAFDGVRGRGQAR